MQVETDRSETPSGRPDATEHLLDAHARAIVQRLLELAEKGDPTALRLCSHTTRAGEYPETTGGSVARRVRRRGANAQGRLESLAPRVHSPPSPSSLAR